MSAHELLESFVRLITKLDLTKDNADGCKKLKRYYRPILASDNSTKKENAASMIRGSMDKLYKLHRDDILSKDFTFLKEGDIILGDVDIVQMYLNLIDSDDEDNIKLVTNELLYLFYLISPPDDRQIIDERYRKKVVKEEVASPNPTPESIAQKVQPNLAKRMEKMLQKNSHKLKKAEKDPNAIPDVLADFFQNNSQDMAGMLTGMLQGMGLNPSDMNRK